MVRKHWPPACQNRRLNIRRLKVHPTKVLKIWCCKESDYVHCILYTAELGMLRLIRTREIVMQLKKTVFSTAALSALLFSSVAFADIKVGFIGSLSSDTGLSTLRGAEIAIEELNANGGVMGEKIVMVSADTGEDVTEGVKAYEYLAETEEVDFIISGSIDDVSLGWLPRMQEFQIPTLDTWTSYIGIIDMVVEDPETMAPYFMNIASDEALATLYINFGADVLKKEMGWESVVILAEDTAFGGAITGLVTDALGPVAGIEVKEIITYDINTNDFAPLFSKAEASDI